MKACHTISITAVVLVLALTTNVSGLKPIFDLPRAVASESAPATHDTPSVPRVSDARPATNVDALRDGSMIFGSIDGKIENLVLAAGSEDFCTGEDSEYCANVEPGKPNEFGMACECAWCDSDEAE